MNKELEAWNFIKEQMQNFTFSHLVTEMIKNTDIVEQALQRLEAIDNSNPSEALEIVDKMANYILLDEEYGFIDDEEKQTIIEDRDTIKQALLKSQEQEKALKIIFEKNVNIKALKYYLKFESALKIYNSNVSNDEELTQEEFDTLKRWVDEHKI